VLERNGSDNWHIVEFWCTRRWGFMLKNKRSVSWLNDELTDVEFMKS
jgi:hypothetical protein